MALSMALNPSPGQLKVIKAGVFVLSLVPLARLVFGAGQAVEPVEFVTRGTGDWALYFLCLTLTVTPLRKLSGWNWLLKLRRMLGLYSFFYALLHFLVFLLAEHALDLASMWRDVLKRPFITVGFIAFVLLIPLAATSTNAMIRRLGGKRWQWLHRLIYLIAPLGILHFWWMKAGKNDFAEPILFGVIVGGLLLARVVMRRAPAVVSRG